MNSTTSVVKEQSPSAVAAVAKQSTVRFPESDLENAELFAALHKNKLRYEFSRKRWFVWQDHRWVLDNNGQVQREARRAIQEMKRLARADEDEEHRSKKLGSVRRNQSRQKLDAMLSLAQSEPTLAIDGASWDSNPFLLGVANGVVDLRTGKLRDGRPDDNISLHTEISFDPVAQCPRWMQFLSEVFCDDTDLIDYVHRAVGYSLTGDTYEQCLFLFYGTGANGKSIFLETARLVGGQYAVNIPFSVLEQQARSSAPNDLAMLPGRRMALSSETSEMSRLNEARIKAWTGCDRLTARFLYGEYFQFVPVAKLWLAVNHLPRILDSTHGLWRRIRVIPFSRQFSGPHMDKKLADKLRAEVSGILAWAVRGCLEWQARGLGDVPKAVEQATQCYQEGSDIVAQFIEECCRRSEEDSISVGTLYSAYQEWSKANGERSPLDRTAFGQRIQAKGFVKVRKGHGRTWTWVGIDLTTNIRIEEGGADNADIQPPILSP